MYYAIHMFGLYKKEYHKAGTLRIVSQSWEYKINGPNASDQSYLHNNTGSESMFN